MDSQKVGIKTFIHFVIMCLIMLLVASINPVAPLTKAGVQMLGILLGCIYGWATLGLILPSLVGIFLMGFNELIGHAGALANSFGNANVVMMLLLFALVQLAQDEKMPEVIATWSLSRKFIQGRPMLYSWIIFIVTCVLGMVNLFLSIFVMWKILYGLFDQLGYKKGEAYANIMLIGVTMFSMLGMIMFPFMDTGLIIMSAYNNIVGTPIPYSKYLLTMLPIIMLLAIVWLVIGKIIFRMDLSKLKNASTDMLDLSLLKLNKRQKATIVMILLFVVTVLAQAAAPKTLPIIGYIAQANLYATMLVVIVVGSLWHIDGKPLMDFRSLMSRGVSWDTWLLTAFGLLISAYLTIEGTGVTAFLVTSLMPILNGVSVYFMIVIVLTFAFLVTNITNNVVVALCLLPVLNAFSLEMGFDIEPVMLIVMVAANFALLTPSASGAASVLFGNTQWLSKRDIYKYVPVLLVILLIVNLTIGYFWANVIF